jgi:hypothetical protein
MICTTSAYVSTGRILPIKVKHLVRREGKKGVHWDVTMNKRDVNLNKNHEG